MNSFTLSRVLHVESVSLLFGEEKQSDIQSDNKEDWTDKSLILSNGIIFPFIASHNIVTSIVNQS